MSVVRQPGGRSPGGGTRSVSESVPLVDADEAVGRERAKPLTSSDLSAFGWAVAGRQIMSVRRDGPRSRRHALRRFDQGDRW